MSLESLGDYLGKSQPTNYQKIYLAFQLQKEIEKRFGQSVDVVIKNRVVVLACESAMQCQYFLQRRSNLESLVRTQIGGLYKLRVKVA